ncbi:HORMA domain-containing protein 1 [Trichinella pseudospiralis]|uniref:HORMA domain-containing protein 1 n=1 Tax=Trichinella pseudospiralis TaxID=6337 RepID=A0A0V0YLN3_TRIPS|nr:HORMA domain-containing protein 1 [Trichinella pseudospiralis]
MLDVAGLAANVIWTADILSRTSKDYIVYVMSERNKKSSVAMDVLPIDSTSPEKSLMYLKQLLAVSVSTICYLRNLFPADAFSNREFEGTKLQILVSNHPKVLRLIHCMTGCYEAIDRKYLRKIIFGICPREKDPENVVESYMFRITYHHLGTIDLEFTSDSTGRQSYSASVTKHSTIQLLRSINLMCQNLEPMPENTFISIKLLYYDERTPADYEPPGFLPCQNAEFRYSQSIHKSPIAVDLGKVHTNFCTVSLCVKSTLYFPYDDDDSADENHRSPLMQFGIECETVKQQCTVIEQENEEEVENLTEENEESFVDVLFDDSSERKRHRKVAVVSQHCNCICGKQKVENAMLYCEYCNTVQHAICYGKVNVSKTAVERTACLQCCLANRTLVCHDGILLTNPRGVKALCLYRRALMLLKNFNQMTISLTTFQRELEISHSIAGQLCQQLVNDGCLFAKSSSIFYVQRYVISILCNRIICFDNADESKSNTPQRLPLRELNQLNLRSSDGTRKRTAKLMSETRPPQTTGIKRKSTVKRNNI